MQNLADAIWYEVVFLTYVQYTWTREEYGRLIKRNKENGGTFYDYHGVP